MQAVLLSIFVLVMCVWRLRLAAYLLPADQVLHINTSGISRKSVSTKSVRSMGDQSRVPGLVLTLKPVTSLWWNTVSTVTSVCGTEVVGSATLYKTICGCIPATELAIFIVTTVKLTTVSFLHIQRRGNSLVAVVQTAQTFIALLVEISWAERLHQLLHFPVSLTIRQELVFIKQRTRLWWSMNSLCLWFRGVLMKRTVQSIWRLSRTLNKEKQPETNLRPALHNLSIYTNINIWTYSTNWHMKTCTSLLLTR